MFNLSVREVMSPAKGRTLAPESTVSAAAQLMARMNIGAVLVVEHGRLVGIFTERDALYRVIARGLDPRSTPVADVMTRSVRTLDPGKSYGHALVVMQENGFRHVAVIEDGVPIGIVSARNAMDPDLEEFASEAQRRKHLREEV